MKKILLTMMALFSVVLLVACTNLPNYSMDDIENAIVITYAEGDDQEHVTQDITLPRTHTSYAEAFITWQSNNQDVINNSGVVTRPTVDTDVTLIYSISYQGEARIGSITVTVRAERPSIDEIEDAIALGFVEGDDKNHVSDDVTLPTVSTLNANATISWNSSNQTIISNSGLVTRPDSDSLVTLTYTITYYDETKSGTFFLVVLEKETYYTVTFNSNGGSLVEEISVLENLTIDEPTDPTRNGYTFVGWYSDVDLLTTYNFDLPITENTTIYAKWSIIEVFYTITFDSNGGSPVSPVVGSNTTAATQPPNPTKDGYIFAGWYTSAVLAIRYTFNAPLSSDMTLYAKWNIVNNTDYTGIYDGAEGLYGTTLINFLYDVVIENIAGNEQDYGDARYTLDNTDQDPNNPSNVILVYLGTSVSGVWDGGTTWNREHVWPQSLLGESADNSVVNMASDLHNLKPANPATNSSRGNKWFGDATTTYSYAPRADVRGDIARILFYMAVRYHDTLTLINISSGDPNVYQMGDLATLLIWNLEDPVDTFEMNRNNMIESYQGNRNPFIDYPEFADLIWG